MRVLADAVEGPKLVLDFKAQKDQGLIKRGAKIDWAQYLNKFISEKSTTQRIQSKMMDWVEYSETYSTTRGWDLAKCRMEWNKHKANGHIARELDEEGNLLLDIPLGRYTNRDTTKKSVSEQVAGSKAVNKVRGGQLKAMRKAVLALVWLDYARQPWGSSFCRKDFFLG